MIRKKLIASSPLLLVLLLSAVIVLIIMITRKGTIEQIRKGQEIKNEVQIDLQAVSTSTDNYNLIIEEALNE